MQTSKILNLLLAAVVLILVIKIAVMADVAPVTSVAPVSSVAGSQGNAVLDNIFARKSVRAYTNVEVSRARLDTLVRAAMAAPSAVNKQPWAFVIVDERVVLDSLAANLPFAKMLTGASAAVVVCGDTRKALLDVNDSYWVQDCSAASQNLLLAAESMGLGAVWTGVFPRHDRIGAVRDVLRLPAHLMPLNVISIGYPMNPDQKPKDKYKKENIFWNRF